MQRRCHWGALISVFREASHYTSPIPQDVLKQPRTYPSHHPLANCLTRL